jgi:hypothetical protein
MKDYQRLLRFVLMSSISVVAFSDAAAQREAANETNVSGSQRAPDWLVWRVFHDSLGFYDRQSPDIVEDLLNLRVGFTETERSSFMVAGHAYLRQLAAIDEQARAELAVRYDASVAPPGFHPSAAKAAELVRPGIQQAAPRLVAGHAPDGRSIQEESQPGGIVPRVMAQREAAFRLHHDALLRSFGADRLTKLEEWIAAEVAPRVAAVPTAAGPPPPDGLRPPVTPPLKPR